MTRERAETDARPWEQGPEGREESKMFDTNPGGLDRHSDNGRSKVATERTSGISGLIGSSHNFLAVVEQLGTVAPVDCAVLIRGETGTGKEVIARAIHDASARRRQRF